MGALDGIKSKILSAVVNEEKLRHSLELEIMSEYREHRIALQKYREKLQKKESELVEKESELQGKKSEIDKYVLAKGKELQEERERVKEKAKHDLSEMKQYETALRRTELTIIDWLKRVDMKEAEIFEEISNDVDVFKKYNAETVDGFQFEKDFAEILKAQGYENVEVTQQSADYGADIIAEKHGVKYVIQCKYYAHPVGIAAVQQAFAAKLHYSAHVAVVATNSVFTKAAKVLAEETKVLLWNGETIYNMTQGKN